jgi:signal transduction histidine kinase
VFERFYRGDRARRHAPEGTGLGLAIARSIVKRYGGTIALAPSDRPGGTGCTVTVRLPTEGRGPDEA